MCKVMECQLVKHSHIPKNGLLVDVLVVSSLPLVELLLAEQAQLEGMLKTAVNIPLSGSLGSTAINLTIKPLK